MLKNKLCIIQIATTAINVVTTIFIEIINNPNTTATDFKKTNYTSKINLNEILDT